MKEGGIIATSFTIYPNEENGREKFKGRVGGSPLELLFQCEGFYFSSDRRYSHR